MSAQRTEALALLSPATDRLLDTVRGLSDAQLRADSLLPGWSRGHVLTHVARQADAMCNLLTWASTGVETPAYASQESRAADIEAGSGRSADELVADLRASAERFFAKVAETSDDAWGAQVRVLNSKLFPAEQTVSRRLAEVELHHVDLGLEYRAADWPKQFADIELPEPSATFRAERASW